MLLQIKQSLGNKRLFFYLKPKSQSAYFGTLFSICKKITTVETNLPILIPQHFGAGTLSEKTSEMPLLNDFVEEEVGVNEEETTLLVDKGGKHCM